MIYFKSRKDARAFATKVDHYKVVDCGADAEKRWAVKVL